MQARTLFLKETVSEHKEKETEGMSDLDAVVHLILDGGNDVLLTSTFADLLEDINHPLSDWVRRGWCSPQIAATKIVEQQVRGW